MRGGLTRDDAKHATMTTPYGVTRGTICKMLMDGELIKSCKDPKKCDRYVAKVLEECIPEIAVEAGTIMKWLRKVARVLAKANRGTASRETQESRLPPFQKGGPLSSKTSAFLRRQPENCFFPSPF